MALDADTLLDRMQLKHQLTRWRTVAIVLLTLLALLLVHRDFAVTELPGREYIARITVEGVITDDAKRREMLDNLQTNEQVKAVLVYMDTPGGSAIGGEELYLQLSALAEQKPVVILMRTVCASAGYMGALGGSHILAREGSLTGSVGVIIQTMELTDMAESLGITPIIVRSGSNKAAPNPLDELTSSQRDMVENVVDDFYRFFLNLVKTERELNAAQIAVIQDGRIFTGRQALEIGLIDGLGGEKEALAWLEAQHSIPADMTIKNISPRREPENILNRLNQLAEHAVTRAENLTLGLDGLVSIWHPADSQ